MSKEPEGGYSNLVNIEDFRRIGPMDLEAVRPRNKVSPQDQILGQHPILPWGNRSLDILTIAHALGAEVTLFDHSSHVRFLLTYAPYLLAGRNSWPPSFTLYPKGSDEQFSDHPGILYVNGFRNYARVALGDAEDVSTRSGIVEFASQHSLNYRSGFVSNGSAAVFVRSPLQPISINASGLKEIEDSIRDAPTDEEGWDLDAIKEALDTKPVSTDGLIKFALSSQTEAAPFFELSVKGFSQSPLLTPSARYSSGESGGVSIQLGDARRIYYKPDRIIVYGEDELIESHFVLTRDGQAVLRLLPTKSAVKMRERRISQQMRLRMPPTPGDRLP